MSSNQPTPSLSLEEDTAAWEAKFKEARKTKDAIKILDVAKQAVAHIDQRLSQEEATASDDAQKTALLAIKRITYNAAADAWPGWEVDSPPVTTASLEQAKAMAERSLDVVRKLDLGDVQVATAVWLVGALELALGNPKEAGDEFGSASSSYVAGGAPGLALLAKGYTEIARGVGNDASEKDTLERLAQVFGSIETGGFKDGGFWISQLRTAAKVFSKKDEK